MLDLNSGSGAVYGRGDARPGDAVLDRLTRARKLQSLRQNHAESALVVARAALDAQDYTLARSEAESAIRMQPREGAWLLMADIEEAEIKACLKRCLELAGQIHEFLACKEASCAYWVEVKNSKKKFEVSLNMSPCALV